jgi:hypothetical protein
VTTPDRPLYPRIDPPERQPDGTYLVRVHRAPGEIEEVPAKTLKAAQDTFRFFERAAVLLVPRPAPEEPHVRIGRKTALTPRVHKRLVEGIGRMKNYEMIAARAGVSPRSLYRWLEDGERASQVFEEADEDYQEPENDRRVRLFWQDFKEAEASLQFDLCTDVIRSSEWAAKMTYLERRWPSDYGRRMIRVEGTGEPITVVFKRPEMNPGDPGDELIPGVKVEEKPPNGNGGAK